MEYYTAFKPYHLPMDFGNKVYRNIDDLRVNILGHGGMKVEDTPHYKYLEGNKKAYEDYFLPNMGKGLKEDHFPEAFDWLIENFDKSKPIIIRGDRVLDGGHRLAIAKFKGMKKILCIQ